MNSTKHFITSQIKKRVPVFVALLILAGMVWLNMSDIGRKQTWDAEFPMANANITWEQTHFPGAWRQE
ncbi:MAG: hypothetical protein J6S83_05435 [Lachnospiraceae bacterium]|nr:hypothetical protein [Lachnospiraceae bacterium]